VVCWLRKRFKEIQRGGGGEREVVGGGHGGRGTEPMATGKKGEGTT